jgi:hypothetical protein
LLLFAPKPQTIAEMISARTERIRPIVIGADDGAQLRDAGQPELLGSMSTSIGTRAATWGKTVVVRSRTADTGAPS